MTNFAGNPRQLRVFNLTDFDGEPVAPGDIDSVTATFYDETDTAVLIDQPFNAGPDDDWILTWDTTGLDPGDYRAKITVVVSGLPEWKYVPIVLRPDLVA